MSPTVYIVPIEDIDSKLIDVLADFLRSFFPEVIVEKATSMPSEAYAAERQQFHTGYIINHLKIKYTGLRGKVLGVTEEDIFSPEVSFVFGEAPLDGKKAIVSGHRLRPEFHGKKSDETLYCLRLAKEALHQLGHTLGLGHCDHEYCVMNFSSTPKDTDRKNSSPCRDCQHTLLIND